MNKTSVIIGAGKGIRFQDAKTFGLKGFNVALISRSSIHFYFRECGH